MSRTTDATTYDDALVALAAMSPEYGGALSDHAPMVVESLDRLGRPDAIGPFLAAWTPKLRAWGSVPEPEIAGYADARDAFAARIDVRGATSAVQAWCDEAGDGVAGAALHGVIRIAHALEGLARSDTAARRAELARALGYASVRALRLPVDPCSTEDARPLRDVVLSIHALPLKPNAPGLITTALLERLVEHSTFARDAASFTLPVDPLDATRALRSIAIDLFLRGDYLPGRTFTMLHVVTGMDAIARIAARLPSVAAQRLAVAGGRALLAMRVAFVASADANIPPLATASLDALVDRAVGTLNDHAIKLAATLRGSADVPEPTRAAALERWVARVERPTG